MEAEMGAAQVEQCKEQWRKLRQEKHVTLRALINLSSCRFTTQKVLAQTLLPGKSSNMAVILSQYMTGKRNGRTLDVLQLQSLHGEIKFRLEQAGLPLQLPQTTADSSGELPPPAAPPPPAPAPAPSPRHRPRARMVLQLKDIGDARHLGGQCLIMSVGAQAASSEDSRWIILTRGQELRTPLGFRARYTFSSRAAAELGGRTFEIEIKKLNCEKELHIDGSPLWVGREITGIVLDLSERRIVVRVCSKCGM